MIRKPCRNGWRGSERAVNLAEIVRGYEQRNAVPAVGQLAREAETQRSEAPVEWPHGKVRPFNKTRVHVLTLRLAGLLIGLPFCAPPGKRDPAGPKRRD